MIYISEMRFIMRKAKIFKNGRSQAVRLPKEFRFDSDEVYIEKVGNVVKLIPVNDKWSSFVEGLAEFDNDLKLERNQPALQNREGLLE